MVEKEQAQFDKVNALIESTKDKYTTVIIVGVTSEGVTGIETNLGDFYSMRGLLVEAIDELNWYKRKQLVQAAEVKE